MIISIIVAYANGLVIGADNQLLWHLPDDMRNFRRVTMGHYIIMGRKTWESIGTPLPGRTNVVITKNKYLNIKDVLIFHSLQNAIEFAKEKKQNEIFIIGGGQLYRQALPIADKLYITQVYATFDGDTTFPEFNPDQWLVDFRSSHPIDERHQYAFDIKVLSRIGKAAKTDYS
jgi:dihydrofolate reductase